MATYYIGAMPCSSELYHYGVKGMKWGKHLFGLAKSSDQITAGRAAQAVGHLIGNRGLRAHGERHAWEARQSFNRSLSGLKTDAKNTAYNARQFLTGSEDRGRMKSASASISESKRMAEEARSKAAKAGSSYNKQFYEQMASNYERQAAQAQREYDQARSEYESMTLPGMTEKAYRNISKALQGTGINVQELYNTAKERVSKAMTAIAGGVGKATTWIANGWAAATKAISGLWRSGEKKAKIAVDHITGTYDNTVSKGNTRTTYRDDHYAPNAASLLTAGHDYANAKNRDMNQQERADARFADTMRSNPRGQQSGASLNTATGNNAAPILPNITNAKGPRASASMNTVTQQRRRRYNIHGTGSTSGAAVRRSTANSK